MDVDVDLQVVDGCGVLQGLGYLLSESLVGSVPGLGSGIETRFTVGVALCWLCIQRYGFLILIFCDISQPLHVQMRVFEATITCT